MSESEFESQDPQVIYVDPRLLERVAFRKIMESRVFAEGQYRKCPVSKARAGRLEAALRQAVSQGNDIKEPDLEIED